MPDVFNMVLTGNGPITSDEISKAFADRAEVLIPTIVQRDPNSDTGYCYDGNRCEPKNLPWRIYQTCFGIGLGGYPGDIEPADVEAGKHDADIEAGYHEAASSEHWYRYEKDWG